MAEKSLGGLIMVFLLSIVGLALSPTIQSSVDLAVANFTGAAATILELFPLFWAMLMVAIPIAYVIVWLKE